jgi:hypothetical protein
LLENFTGTSVEAVKQDFYATIFICGLESLLTHEANQRLQAKSADTTAFVSPGSSFRDVVPAEEEEEDKTSITRSVAGEVQVPVDMVEKIAQRVVAQISEKVIREIAWEVIPDLAEALIKREIDRLKAELQQT